MQWRYCLRILLSHAETWTDGQCQKLLALSLLTTTLPGHLRHNNNTLAINCAVFTRPAAISPLLDSILAFQDLSTRQLITSGRAAVRHLKSRPVKINHAGNGIVLVVSTAFLTSSDLSLHVYTGVF